MTKTYSNFIHCSVVNPDVVDAEGVGQVHRPGGRSFVVIGNDTLSSPDTPVWFQSINRLACIWKFRENKGRDIVDMTFLMLYFLEKNEVLSTWKCSYLIFLNYFSNAHKTETSTCGKCLNIENNDKRPTILLKLRNKELVTFQFREICTLLH